MTQMAWFAGLAGAWWLVRAAIGRHEERLVDGRFRRGPGGVIVGAEPIRLDGARAGAVLLLHGYNDSPQSVASLASTLHARGWTVRAPLLPGHGRSLREFAASGSREWLEASRAALSELRATHQAIAVGGLSMGAAIAFTLAADQPDVRAVIAFAPYLHVSMPIRVLEFVAPVASLGARYVWGGGTRSVHDPIAAKQMIAYGRSSPRLLVELDRVVRLANAALPRVTQPVLVVQSREDNRIPVPSAERSFARIGSPDKTMHWTTGNGHVVTVDYEHEAFERLAADWLESRLP